VDFPLAASAPFMQIASTLDQLTLLMPLFLFIFPPFSDVFQPVRSADLRSAGFDPTLRRSRLSDGHKIPPETTPRNCKVPQNADPA